MCISSAQALPQRAPVNDSRNMKSTTTSSGQTTNLLDPDNNYGGTALFLLRVITSFYKPKAISMGGSNMFNHCFGVSIFGMTRGASVHERMSVKFLVKNSWHDTPSTEAMAIAEIITQWWLGLRRRQADYWLTIAPIT
nr:calcium-dependent lipid-binding (CaLB domain) family protein [Tanacetum cinerariifolium]